MTADVSPKLYEAATESLVSDASAVSTFEKMINVAHSHAGVETFQQELIATEKQIRNDFEVSSMPGPWRSAKSVLVNAMKLGIGLIDDNGSYYGKTYLQNKIKETKSGVKALPTTAEYADKVIRSLITVPEGVDKSAVWTTVYKYIQEEAK